MLRGISALLFLAAAPSAAPQGAAPVAHQTLPDFIGYVPDELIVVVADDVRAQLTARQGLAGEPLVNLPALQVMLEGLRVERFQRQFDGARPQPVGSPYPDLTGYYKVGLGEGVGLEEAVAAFELNPLIEHVERIGMHTLYQEPNDPYFKLSPNPSFPYDQWHLYAPNGVDAELAWDAQAGSSSVLVGILDSGTRYFHVDLGGPNPVWGPNNPATNGNVFVNGAETPGNGVDDDGNGFIDDTIGWDFVASAGGFGVSCIDQDCSGVDNDPDDADGHGTHTAGTVGAITNNGVLVAGVAGGFGDGSSAGGGNGVKIVPLRIGYHARYQGTVTGVVRMDWAAEAMNYLAGLVDAGHNVASINCSWGSSNSGGLGAAVDNLLAHDVMIIHAAGNSNSSSADYLGTKAGVMSVAATDINGNGASFTNYGSWVEVAAPGVDVLSLYRSPDDPDPTANYIALLSGTSMSAPHVAGIAALLESCFPSLSRQDKFNLIMGNTMPYSDSRNLGAGIANAKLALEAAGCSGTPCDVTADFSASATAGCATLAVDFTDLSTGAGINAWNWDFGDGGSSTAQNPSHGYAVAGTYNVSLTATGTSCSDSVTKSGYVTVGAVPIADFAASTTSGNAPLTVTFSDLSSGVPSSWAWDFGDGGVSSVQNPQHGYANPGTYTVSLTASNGCGADGETKVGYITVSMAAAGAHVDAIVVSKENLGGGNKRARAVVTIVDENGAPVAGATVTGDFSGKTTDIGVFSTTDGNGQAQLLSSSARGGGEWCFEVTGVTGAGTYLSGDNVVTQACESGPVF